MKRKKLVSCGAFLLLVAGMVLAAELTGEREIIFPEMAALAMGSFLTPKLCWKTSFPRMVGCISLCAVLGWGIVLCTSWPLWVQMAAAYTVGQLVYLFSGTSLAPMLSAIVLPVMLQTESILYPAAAFSLVLVLSVVRIALEKFGVKSKNVYERVPPPQREDWLTFCFRTIFVALLCWLCLRLGIRFCVAPPLLVAFTELCRSDCPAVRKQGLVWLLVSLCALIGWVSRWMLVMRGGLPLTCAAVVIAAAEVIFAEWLGLFFPPAGAMGVLALLIPDEGVALYPMQVSIGIALLLFAAALWRRVHREKWETVKTSLP